MDDATKAAVAWLRDKWARAPDYEREVIEPLLSYLDGEPERTRVAVERALGAHRDGVRATLDAIAEATSCGREDGNG